MRDGARIGSIARVVLALCAAALGGCHGSSAPTAPSTTSATGIYPGFDISVYPGDALMQAWRQPASPYYWSSYYLSAPCHKPGASWLGKRATLDAKGWGLTVIYVGQQYWTTAQLAGAADLDRSVSIISTTSCTNALLTAAQGAADADEAIASAAAEGFPAGSTIFLDIEHMDAIPAAMTAYHTAWVERLLRAPSTYRPGIYCHTANAAAISTAVQASYTAAGRTDQPRFWLVGSGTGFAFTKPPTGSGFSFAMAWQNVSFNRIETYGGYTATIDQDVASVRSPSAPAGVNLLGSDVRP